MKFAPLTQQEIYTLVSLLKTPKSPAELAIKLGTSLRRMQAVLEYWKSIGKVRNAHLNGCEAHWLYEL